MERLSKKQIAALVTNRLLGDELAGKSMVVYSKKQKPPERKNTYQFHTEEGHTATTFTVKGSLKHPKGRMTIFIDKKDCKKFPFVNCMATFDGTLVYMIRSQWNQPKSVELDLIIANAIPE